ncbi:MAG: hypothetical protein WCR46_24545 [Deltaproteobacteria bacterium]
MVKIPPGLKAQGKQFWKKIQDVYGMDEAHDIERLKMACRCLDEIEEAELIIAAEGRYVPDRFEKTQEHSGCKAIRDNKTLFCRIIRELALDLTTTGDSRPPRQY